VSWNLPPSRFRLSRERSQCRNCPEPIAHPAPLAKGKVCRTVGDLYFAEIRAPRGKGKVIEKNFDSKGQRQVQKRIHTIQGPAFALLLGVEPNFLTYSLLN